MFARNRRFQNTPTSTGLPRVRKTPLALSQPRSVKAKSRIPDNLSLVASFDDLVRNSLVLNEGSEKEFAQFVAKTALWIKRWRECEVGREQLANLIKEKDKEILAKDYKIKQANTLWSNERNGRLLAEAERDELADKLLQLKSILVSKEVGQHLDNETLERVRRFETTTSKKSEMGPFRVVNESAESILDVSEFSFDESKDELLEESRVKSGQGRYKRRSSGKFEMAKRRRKSRSLGNTLDDKVTEKILETTTKVTMDKDGHAYVESILEQLPVTAGDLRKRARKSRESRGEVAYYEKNETSSAAPPLPTEETNIVIGDKRSGNDVFGSPISPLLRRHFSNAGSIPNRPHLWETKTASISSRCGPCGQRIGFSKKYLRCKECNAICHQECKFSVPLPCVVALNHTPTKGNSLVVLADFAPRDPPFVPAIVQHCLAEIEKRGLEEIGLYRIPGKESESCEVLEKFMKNKNGPPILAKYEIHVITGTLKKFLCSLKEPIIPPSLWKSFVDSIRSVAHDSYDEGFLYQAISELPRPNRDTLSLLIRHLQRVAASPSCKMDSDNLSTVWGPTILGNSTPDPGVKISEAPLQKSVVKALLDLPNEFWERFLLVENDIYSHLAHTPEDGFKKITLDSRKAKFFQSPTLN